MLSIRFLRFIRGTVRFQVQGKFAERFLNLLSRNGIPVFNTQYSKDGFTATTTVKKYFWIRPFVRKTHVKVHVIERHGLPFVLKRYSKRLGLLFGMLLFVLCVCVSGEFVWEIEVNGNETVSDDAILQTLEEFGLTRGKWKKSLDVEKIAMELRQQYDQISWAAVNLVGSVAEVEINEKIEENEIVEDKTPCNIVAARGGQIVSMEVYDGQKVVKKGDTVKKGDLIVSGVVKSPSKGNTILRHANAKVMAEYPESFQVKVELTQELKVPQGGMTNHRYLNIGSLKLPLFLVKKKPDCCYERVFTRPIKLFGITLPFDMTVHQVIPAQQQTVTISEQKAQEFATQQMKAFERQNPFREVVSRKIRKQRSGGQIIFHVDYIFCEDIAQKEEILHDGQ